MTNKKTLIFLFEKFNGNQNLMLKEIVEQNLNVNEEDVYDFLEKNNINEDDYCCFLDKDYPKKPKIINGIPILIFKK